MKVPARFIWMLTTLLGLGMSNLTIMAAPRITIAASDPAQFETAREVLRDAGIQADFTAPDAAAEARNCLFLIGGSSTLPDKFQVIAGSATSAPKVQELSMPPFGGLRLYTPPAPLFDLAEGTLSQAILIPNDPDQPPVQSAERDLAGLRMILGTDGNNRLAFVRAECFSDATLSLQSPAHDNRKILVRLGRWLTASGAD